MSDFFKKFLLEDSRRFGSGARHVALAAFGKHPGWDDHVEDLGLETESLNLAKTVFYVNGLGGQIDSAAWEKLEEAQRLPAFKHVFLWQRSGQILVGRLWSSSDGKGRTRYPMVVCAQFFGVTLNLALKLALPALAELEASCVKAVSAEEVRGLLARHRAALREAILSADDSGEYAPVAPEVMKQILPPTGPAESEGFLRVLYRIQSQFGAYAPGKFNAHANPATVRSQQLRVPVDGLSTEQALLFWTRFFLTQIDPSTPLLIVAPLDEGWVDVTAGQPEPHEFFSLRASRKAVPLVSETPYKLDEDFSRNALAFLEGFRRGDTKVAALAPPAPASKMDAPAKRGWMKWLGVGVVLIAVAAIAFVWLSNPKKSETAAARPEVKGDVSKLTVKPAAETSAPTAVQPGETAARLKESQAAKAEAARLVEEKKKSDALAAATKLRIEAELAATEKAQAAEAARLKLESDAAMQKEKEAQAKRVAEAETTAKIKADQEAKKLAAAVVVPATNNQSSVASATPAAAVAGEMTNSIGMVLVRLPSGIWAGKYEVTQADYLKVMGANPSKSVNELQPVEQVTWHEAVEFARKLTEMERDKLPPGRVYSLPTGKQWQEFQGGQKFEDLPGRGFTGRGRPTIVGQSGPANKFGLSDVLGNVWEWCLDSVGEGKKLVKGGAFNSVLYEQTLLPDSKLANCGFRCVLASQ